MILLGSSCGANNARQALACAANRAKPTSGFARSYAVLERQKVGLVRTVACRPLANEQVGMGILP